ncbi:hypothetical protein [Nonomuraea basaltis]|uniref:hypothetical protein n=1 Tax=Nonomuraea basaltis TaxID=2495887 RepID=UPI00110C62D4|nr:hypothetical protein [Nonomuraea basaltis]TMR95444.1 hypothetical protein EJK15_28450 [Nonomuraea basaltis]
MTRDRIAALAGSAAGVLGIVAGLAATLLGGELGDWAGGKQDPVPLGLVTVALSAVAVAASMDLLRTRTTLGPGPGRRAAIAAGQLLPGLVCFTTVGRLWWVPGSVLVLASAATVSAAPAAVIRAVRGRWLAILTGALGVCFVVVAATADALLALAAMSAVLVAVSPWVPPVPRRRPAAMLLLGAVPFAVFTWWTLVTPLLAVLALISGLAALRRHDQGATL